MNPYNFRDLSLAVTLIKKSSNQQTALSTARQSAEDSLDEKLIDSFGTLPDSEQADIIQRVDKLTETLVTIVSIAKPLINFILSCIQDCQSTNC